jgi:hypothetical protein
MDDDTIIHLLQDAECVVDIDPGSLRQRKRALRAWMADGEDTGRPASDDRPTGPPAQRIHREPVLSSSHGMPTSR